MLGCDAADWFRPQYARPCNRCDADGTTSGHDRCNSFTMCGDTTKPARAFCCGRFVTPPKETFWGGKLPRIVAEQPRGVMTLPGNVIDFTD